MAKKTGFMKVLGRHDYTVISKYFKLGDGMYGTFPVLDFTEKPKPKTIIKK